jgi:protein TonB
VASIPRDPPPANSASPAATPTEQQIEIARLTAEIEKAQQTFNSRPRRKYVSSSTQHPAYRSYMEAWKQHIEHVGNSHYPEQLRSARLFGQVVMTAAIAKNGELLEAKVEMSSGSDEIDSAALAIVKLASPFKPIPTDDDLDILYITRTWSFGAAHELHMSN